MKILIRNKKATRALKLTLKKAGSKTTGKAKTKASKKGAKAKAQLPEEPVQHTLVEEVGNRQVQSEKLDFALPEIGSAVSATLVSAKVEGLVVNVGCHKGLVCGGSLGKSVKDRDRLVEELIPGQTLRCIVRAYNEKNRRLSLELVESQGKSRDFGLVDAANVIGSLQEEDLRKFALPKICDFLADRKITPLCIIRAATLSWLKRTNPSIYPSILGFANQSSRAIIVDSRLDDDLFLLDFLKTHPQAIAISRDHYQQYHPGFAEEIKRVHTFVPVIGVPGLHPYLMIDGLGKVEL